MSEKRRERALVRLTGPGLPPHCVGVFVGGHLLQTFHMMADDFAVTNAQKYADRYNRGEHDGTANSSSEGVSAAADLRAPGDAD